MALEEWFIDPFLNDTAGTGTRMTVTLAGATFTTGTWNLLETNAFTGYTFNAGDRIHISGGTAVTAGYYEVASRTDDSNIVLVGDITTDASSPTDVTSTTRPYEHLSPLAGGPCSNVRRRPQRAFRLGLRRYGSRACCQGRGRS